MGSNEFAMLGFMLATEIQQDTHTGPVTFRLPTELATGVIAIFAMLLAVMIMGPVAALERPLPLLPLQLPPTTFNVGCANDV
jgi:hypothetical protein